MHKAIDKLVAAGKIKETSNVNYKNTENGKNSVETTKQYDENGNIVTTTKVEKTYGANSYYREKTSITDNKTNITKTEEYKYDENNVLFEKIEEVFDTANNEYDRTVTTYNANGEIESVKQT